ELDPPSAGVLRQDADGPTGLDDDPREHGPDGLEPGDPVGPPGPAAPPGDVEVAADRVGHTWRPVRRDGQQPLIRRPGPHLGPGRGGKRQAGEEADPRQLDITPVSVHWPGSTLEA